MGYLKEELARANLKRIGFDTSDGVWRYISSEDGLWRRYAITCLDKEGKAKKGWGSAGEVVGEGEDMHFVTTNGVKVFMFPKKEKVKDGK